MWLENNVASPSISLRQSRCSSHATPNHVINCAPACDKRSHAECRVISLKVPDASVTTKTSNPSSMAESAGNATQTSVTTPAIIIARKFILEFFIKQFTQGLVFICLGCIINICRERTNEGLHCRCFPAKYPAHSGRIFGHCYAEPER